MIEAPTVAALGDEGIIQLPGLVDPAVAQDVTDGVWAFFARRGVDRADPSTWPSGFQSGLQMLPRSARFDRLDHPSIDHLVSSLLDGRPVLHDSGWKPLVTFPQPAAAWTVPAKMWHLDVPGKGDPSGHGVVRLFVVLAEARPRGGNTLVLAGSSRRIRSTIAASATHDVGSSSRLKRSLQRSHPAVAALLDESSEGREQVVADLLDQGRGGFLLVEMVGQPGDAYLMDQWSLHTLSPNHLDAPRLVATRSWYADLGFFGG